MTSSWSNHIISSLLEQLPQALNGNSHQTQAIDTSFEAPHFHPAKKVFNQVYMLDELNNQIISYLQKKWYTTPEQVIELPKLLGPDLVIDAKWLFELNKTSDFKKFVEQLYDDILGYNWDLCTFELKWIFINLHISAIYLSQHLAQLLKNEETFGSIQYPEYTGGKLLMEYSAPNMAKSMSIGHFRNTIIGQIMYNILQQTWCEHFNWNYIGDRGTAFGKFVVSLQYCYQQDPQIIDQILSNPESMMGVVYGKFKEIDVPNKEEIARNIVQLLETDSQIVVQLWIEIRKLSLMDFETVYKVLNIAFDCTLGESFSVKLDNGILQDLQAKDIVHESQGALIIKLKRTAEGNWKPLQSQELDTREEGRDQVLVFAKSDGSTLYAPRDLALLKYRTTQLQADKMMYVVWSEQSVYFEHIIALGIYLGYLKPAQMMHLGFGLYLQNGKKMASRSGGAYRVMDLVEEITQAIVQQFEDRIDYNTAQKLAVSALIINDTKGDISKDVNLDIPSMTKLNGDTWVYIQYTAVRLRSLIEKIGYMQQILEQHTIDQLSPEEKSLLFQTSLLPHKLKQSLDLIKPHVLTQYLLDLAGKFNKWYNDSPKVVEMEDNQKAAISLLLQSYLLIMEKTMNLLHLPRVDKM